MKTVDYLTSLAAFLNVGGGDWGVEFNSAGQVSPDLPGYFMVRGGDAWREAYIYVDPNEPRLVRAPGVREALAGEVGTHEAERWISALGKALNLQGKILLEN